MEEGLDGFAQVFDQMKPIDHLHGLGCPTANALGVEGTPVPTDYGDRRMLREPGGHALRRALGQEVQDLIILQIGQDGPVALPAPPRPLVHPMTLWGGVAGVGAACTSPQQGVWTDALVPAGREPRACLPAEGEAEGKEALGKP